MFLNFLFLHIIFVLLFLFINLKNLQNKKIIFLCQKIIVFLIPLFGFLFVIITMIFEKISSSKEIPFYMYDDLQYMREFPVNDKKEISKYFLPVSDVLMLENINIKRQIFRDIVLRISPEKIGLLRQALVSTDSEVALYAASALMELKNKLENDLKEKEKIFLKYQNVENIVNFNKSFEILISSGLLNNIESLKIKTNYIKVLENFDFSSMVDYKTLFNFAKVLIELEEYTKAEKICRLFQEKYPNDEKPYLLVMEISFKNRNLNKLKNLIKSTKYLNVKLSDKSLKLISFWEEKGLNHEK